MNPKYGRIIVWVALILVTQVLLQAGFYEHFTMIILLDTYFISGLVLLIHWFFWEYLS